LPAIVKGMIVFAVTLVLSYAATAAICSVPIGARLIRGQRRTTMVQARSSAAPTPSGVANDAKASVD